MPNSIKDIIERAREAQQNYEQSHDVQLEIPEWFQEKGDSFAEEQEREAAYESLDD